MERTRVRLTLQASASQVSGFACHSASVKTIATAWRLSAFVLRRPCVPFAPAANSLASRSVPMRKSQLISAKPAARCAWYRWKPSASQLPPAAPSLKTITGGNSAPWPSASAYSATVAWLSSARDWVPPVALIPSRGSLQILLMAAFRMGSWDRRRRSSHRPRNNRPQRAGHSRFAVRASGFRSAELRNPCCRPTHPPR